MAILRNICIALLAVVLTGCYEDFTPDIDVKPVLCMNSLITAGRPIEVAVTRTVLYTDENQDFTVNDARITIYVNDEAKDADYIPREGDRIRLIAESNTYGSAQAEVVVPYSVKGGSFNWRPYLTDVRRDDSIGYDMCATIQFNLDASLTIDDSASEENYYRFAYISSHPHYGDDDMSGLSFHTGTFRYESEPIFAEHIGVFDSMMGGDAYGFTFFTDRQFNGDNYTLHLQYSDCQYSVASPVWSDELLDCEVEFTLYSVSKSYYNLAIYMWHRDYGSLEELGNIGLGDPIWGYSNVSTGAGVVAAQSYTTYKLSLRDFLMENLSEKNSCRAMAMSLRRKI